jgi:hypothetical protein
VHLLNAGKLEARVEEAIRVYWMGKCRVLVERNITFAPIDIEDVLNEGESSAVYIISTGTSSATVNAPNVQVIPKVLTPPPQLPTPLPMRETHTRHPPGYYAQLNEGQVTLVAIESLMEASEIDLLYEEAHIHLALAVAQPEPTLQQALNGLDGVKWQEVLDYEISQLEKLSYPIHLRF